MGGIDKTNVTICETVMLGLSGRAVFCKLAKLKGAGKAYLIGTRDSRLA